MNDSTPYGKRTASVEYWASNRNTMADLYPSETHFLSKKLPHCRSVLDVGCAAGGFIEVCREVVPDVAYTGIDVSSNLIGAARDKHANGNSRFEIYDGARFPEDVVKTGFDLVYSFGVLHHVPHWADIVAQMIEAARKYVCFDLRLSYEGRTRGHQKIDFNEVWDGETSIDYIVEDFFDTVARLHRMVGGAGGLALYGYQRPPTDKATVDRDAVIMASFMVDKTAEGKSLQVDVSR